MNYWLVVTLHAPFASFGENAGNVQRGSALRPSRSSLIGLAGAALGVDREDVTAQRELSRSFLTATRTIDPGTPVADFHTFQSLPRGKGPVTTRAEALTGHRDDLNTSITRRDYRACGLWQAAYMNAQGATLSLEGLAAAFARPHFALWLGRKSCPLSHPLAPQLITTDDVSAAFASQAAMVGLTADADGGVLAVDERIVTAGAARTGNSSRRERRTDEPGDRSTWQFSARYEHVYSMPKASTGQAGDRI